MPKGSVSARSAELCIGRGALTLKQTERKMTKARMRMMRMTTRIIFLCCHHILRLMATPVLWKRSAWKRKLSVLSTRFSIRSPRASTCTDALQRSVSRVSVAHHEGMICARTKVDMCVHLLDVVYHDPLDLVHLLLEAGHL